MEGAPVKAIIFCGGVGTRMWPMSRQKFPKQFQKIVGDESMFQSTVKRVLKGFKPQDVYISTGKEYLNFIFQQAPQIPRKNIIGEPVRRDSMAAVGLANLMIHHYFPNAIVAAIWGADHIVKNEEEFDNIIKNAASYSAKNNLLVKIDVKPTFPSEHNGWVKIGKKRDSIGKYDIYDFENFIEKPNEETAKKLFKSHQYLINTGYLVWPAKLMVDLFKVQQPEVSKVFDEINLSLGTWRQGRTIKRLYPQIPKISIDYGIFEHLSSQNTVVIPSDLGWTDVGTWELLYEGITKNQKDSNVIKGQVELIETQKSLVYSTVPDKVVSVIGMNGVVVIDTYDGLVVCDIHHTDKVKQLVEKLKENHQLKKYT